MRVYHSATWAGRGPDRRDRCGAKKYERPRAFDPLHFKIAVNAARGTTSILSRCSYRACTGSLITSANASRIYIRLNQVSPLRIRIHRPHAHIPHTCIRPNLRPPRPYPPETISAHPEVEACARPFPTLIILLTLAACERSNGDQEPSAQDQPEQRLDGERALSANDNSLEGVEWHLTEISAPDEDVTREQLTRAVTLEFLPEDHERETGARVVTGYAPCNTFSATYLSEAEGEISFSDIIRTRMACEDDVMRHERLLFDALDNAEAYQVDESTLRISSDSISLRYDAGPSSERGGLN